MTVVSPCTSRSPSCRADLDRIRGRVNKLNLRNDKVLVQELAVGTEYEVDTYDPVRLASRVPMTCGRRWDR